MQLFVVRNVRVVAYTLVY